MYPVINNHIVCYSLLFGNLFVHFQFAQDGSAIPDHARFIVYAALTGTGVVGTLLIIAMRKPPESDQSAVNL